MLQYFKEMIASIRSIKGRLAGNGLEPSVTHRVTLPKGIQAQVSSAVYWRVKRQLACRIPLLVTVELARCFWRIVLSGLRYITWLPGLLFVVLLVVGYVSPHDLVAMRFLVDDVLAHLMVATPLGLANAMQIFARAALMLILLVGFLVESAKYVSEIVDPRVGMDDIWRSFSRVESRLFEREIRKHGLR